LATGFGRGGLARGETARVMLTLNLVRDLFVLWRIVMDANASTARMKREIYPVPDDVTQALNTLGLLEAYHGRPAYQQNDYVGWITRAKRQETRQKRISQMLDELQAGGVYMNMKWNG